MSCCPPSLPPLLHRHRHPPSPPSHHHHHLHLPLPHHVCSLLLLIIMADLPQLVTGGRLPGPEYLTPTGEVNVRVERADLLHQASSLPYKDMNKPDTKQDLQSSSSCHGRQEGCMRASISKQQINSSRRKKLVAKPQEAHVDAHADYVCADSC